MFWEGISFAFSFMEKIEPFILHSPRTILWIWTKCYYLFFDRGWLSVTNFLYWSFNVFRRHWVCFYIVFQLPAFHYLRKLFLFLFPYNSFVKFNKWSWNHLVEYFLNGWGFSKFNSLFLFPKFLKMIVMLSSHK